MPRSRNRYCHFATPSGCVGAASVASMILDLSGLFDHKYKIIRNR